MHCTVHTSLAVLKFSGNISSHWPLIPCLLVAMHSKDVEIPWPLSSLPSIIVFSMIIKP